MEAVGSVLLLANLFAIADNIYRGIRLVRNVAQDPKVDGFYVRLITEKARYAEWKRRMGINTDKDIKKLISKLPEDARQSLPMILAPIEKYARAAEELFKKYGITAQEPRDSHQTFTKKLRRVNLLVDGHGQVNDILDTLKNCNDGLLTIAPPAPGYYLSLARNDQILETSDDVQYTRSDAVQPRHPFHSRTQSSLSLTAPASGSPPAPSSSLPEQANKVFHSVIELLFSTCLQVLRSIERQYPAHHTTFQGIGDRIEIWGTGLFHGQVSIDQALNHNSEAISLLRENISGTLADTAVVLRHILSTLGEPDSSSSTLQLRELFSISEIASLPQGSLYLEQRSDEDTNSFASLEFWSGEVADLTESLFCTLSTTEMVMKDTVARQKSDSAIDELDLVLIKSDSDISLPNPGLAPTKDLLRIDLELIAAMQESLKDSKLAKYLEHRDLKFDAVQLSKDLGEESRQMKYWASQLGSSRGNQTMTSETHAAMVLNLTRIARTFEAQFKSLQPRSDLVPDMNDILKRCSKQFPEFGAALTSPVSKSNKFDPLEVLKSSNLELKRLARSKAPELRYVKDFGLSEKAKLAAAERATESSSM